MSEGGPSFADRELVLPPGTFPFESRFCGVGATQLHYVDEGAGPILLMIHGNPSWAYLYRGLIERLRGDFRCIAVDLAGFGLSPPPPDFSYKPEDHAKFIAAFLEALDLENVTLVAHDWGGPIGLAAAKATGRRITRLCLGNTWAWPINGDFHFEWFSRLLGGPIGRWAATRHAVFVNFVLPSSMRRRKLTPAELMAFRAPFDDRQPRTGMHVFPAEITGAGPWLAELEPFVASFKGPVHFLWPDADIAFREKELARWRTLCPQAEVTLLKSCGHFLWLEAPDETAAAIRTFVER
jgi:haloalkane dehalogenase